MGVFNISVVGLTGVSMFWLLILLLSGSMNQQKNGLPIQKHMKVFYGIMRDIQTMEIKLAVLNDFSNIQKMSNLKG
jgi:hypothetical protein